MFLSFLKSNYSWTEKTGSWRGCEGGTGSTGQAALVEHHGMVGMGQHCVAEPMFIMLPIAKVTEFAF